MKENSQRTRKILKTATSILASRGVAIICNLIYVPLTISYTNTETFGFLELLISFSFLATFLDLGLSFSLQNKIPSITDDTQKNAYQIAATFTATLTLSAIALALLFLSQNLPFWDSLNNFSDINPEGAKTALLIALALTIAQTPFNITTRIRLGLQEGHINANLRSVSTITSTTLLSLVLITQKNPNIILLGSIIPGSNLTAQILNSLLLKKKYSFVSFLTLTPQAVAYIKSVTSTSLRFMYLQTANIALNSLDRLILLTYSTPTHLATYSICFRLCTLLSTPAEAASLPSLPAINEAIHKKDFKWLRNYIKTSSKLFILLAATVATIAYTLSDTIIELWLGKSAQSIIIQPTILAVFSAYLCLNSYISYIALSSHTINKIILPYSCASIVAIASKIFLTPHFGYNAILMSTALASTTIFLSYSFRMIQKIGTNNQHNELDQ